MLVSSWRFSLSWFLLLGNSFNFFLGSVHGEEEDTGPTNVVQLTVENFESALAGKNVFIKFFAPWCGHCRAMKEDWEKLATDFKDHPVVVIGEVDCTSDEGEPICSDFEVQGFPTLVHGDPMSAETYEGGRDYESLSEFTKSHLTKPICSLFRMKNCNEEEQAVIAELESKTDDEIHAIVNTVEGKVKEQEEEFDGKVQVIQKQYDELVKEFNHKLDEIKAQHHFKFVEQIIAKRNPAPASDEDDEGDDEGDYPGDYGEEL